MNKGLFACFLMFNCICLPVTTFGQDDTLDQAEVLIDDMPAEEVTEQVYSSTEYTRKRSADTIIATESDWKKASAGLDYSDEGKPKEKKIVAQEAKPITEVPAINRFAPLLQGLAVLLAVILIGIGIYFVARSPRDKKIQGNYDIAIDRIEERLHETDLMRYLREALAQGDYAVAIRLYFLQMLKDLSNQGRIKWAKEKTNRNYMNELTGHTHHAQMLANTRMYETVWFGNTTLTKGGFKLIEPDFREILSYTGDSLQAKQ
jgi:hypothetical protein